ncbi:uncharacterized protein LOC144871779 isoform X3 [Branchiostoma floridae x Branchiostoma japonicum]
MGGARGREEERTHEDARRSLTLKRTPARRNLPYYCIDTWGAGQDAAGTGVWHKAGKRSQDYSSEGKLQGCRGTYLTITSDDGGSSRSIFEAAAGKRLSVNLPDKSDDGEVVLTDIYYVHQNDTFPPHPT